MKEDPYSLDQLRDLIEPAPIGWWPPAPGWWFLLALLVIWAIAGVVLAWRRWRRDAYRREGLQMLDILESSAHSDGQRVKSLVSLSALLKRVALAAYPRELVASLSGEEWLAFLDRTSPTADFSTDPARRVAIASYEGADAAPPNAAEFREICRSAQTWIETHSGEAEAC